MRNFKLLALIVALGLGVIWFALKLSPVLDTSIGRVDLIATSTADSDAGRKLHWKLDIPSEYVVSRSGLKGIRSPDAVRANSQNIVLTGMIDSETYVISPYVQKGTRQGYSFEMKTSNWVRGRRSDLFQGCVSKEAYHKRKRSKSILARECRNKGYCPFMIGKGRWKADVSLHVSLKDDPLVCEALDRWLDHMTLSIDDDLFD